MRLRKVVELGESFRCDYCDLSYCATQTCLKDIVGWCPYCGKKQKEEITKERGNEMKKYSVTIKQEVETSIIVRAASEDDAQEVVEGLISDDKIQHLIDEGEDLLACEAWEVESVEEV